jgi:hypothetical protein
MKLQNNLSVKTINIMILGGKHQLAKKKTPCFCALLAHSTPKLLLISWYTLPFNRLPFKFSSIQFHHSIVLSPA